jgi:hypothetical protein
MVTQKDDPELKERVIHTRVPESLDDELRKRANELGVSVSNLIRNVLGHAFGLVGDAVGDAAAIARAARGGRSNRPAESAVEPSARTEAVAWQTAKLAKNAVCTRCNTILPRGSDAALGIVDGVAGAGVRPIVCLPCRDALIGHASNDGGAL